MKKSILRLLIILSFINISQAQTGKLLVIGGGSEKDTDNSWNSKAYKWAVNKSANKRIAIIAYGAADNWLPQYFQNKCGALYAKNFDISSREIADAQSTYDSVMQYDVIFLKGGDQYDYYSTYKNTKLQQALIQKFNQGGVICGTSAGLAVLSEVIFTAKNGSAYSDVVIKNTQHSSIQLANDFLPFFPNAIFDSHFTRRGRLGRLVAFMANWHAVTGEIITGIGVDEMTALAIDENKMGEVYGIGAVHIINNKSNIYTTTSGMLIADSLSISQLTQASTIDFSTKTINGFSKSFFPEKTEENGDYTIYASGSDIPAKNTAMLEAFASDAKNRNGNILIFTGENQQLAISLKAILENQSGKTVKIYTVNALLANNQELNSEISSTHIFVFAGNEYNTLLEFMLQSPNGQKAMTRMKEKSGLSLFIGDNSRFAGKSFITNYLQLDAAYYGEFQISTGLGLLTTTAIIPNTFSDADLYENTASALPYLMLSDNLAYGIWLNADNYIKYNVANDGKTYISSYGTSPVMALYNTGTHGNFSTQTAYGDGKDNFPNFAGFENMQLKFLNETLPLQTGSYVVNQIKDSPLVIPYTFQQNTLQFYEVPEPAIISIIHINGSIIYRDSITSYKTIQLHDYKSGTYIMQIENTKSTHIFTQKLIIQH